MRSALRVLARNCARHYSRPAAALVRRVAGSLLEPNDAARRLQRLEVEHPAGRERDIDSVDGRAAHAIDDLRLEPERADLVAQPADPADLAEHTERNEIAAVAVANDVGVRDARFAQAFANLRECLVGLELGRNRRNVDPIAAPDLAFGDALLRLEAVAAQRRGGGRGLRQLAKRADARAVRFGLGGTL